LLNKYIQFNYLKFSLLIFIIFSSVFCFGEHKYIAEFSKIYGTLKHKTNSLNKFKNTHYKFLELSLKSLVNCNDDSSFNVVVSDFLDSVELSKNITSIKNYIGFRFVNSYNSIRINYTLNKYYKSKSIYSPNRDLYFENTNISIFADNEISYLSQYISLWNTLYYFHINRNVNYDSLLNSGIDIILNEKNYIKAFTTGFKVLDDNHSHFFNEILNKKLLKDFYQAEINVSVVNDSFYVIKEFEIDSFVSKNISLNDTLMSINGVLIKNFVDNILPFFPNTERISKRNAGYYFFFSNKNDTLNLEFKNNKKYVIKIETKKLKGVNYKKSNAIVHQTKKTIWVNLLALSGKNDEKKLLKLFNEKDTIVLDLRGHITFFPKKIINVLSKNKTLITTLEPDLDNIGQFKKRETSYGKNKNSIKNIYVLIDSYTQSASELLAIVLKETGSILVGVNTAGANGASVTIPLYTNTKFVFTISQFYSESNAHLFGKGVSPNIYMPEIIQISNFHKLIK
jgi:C-terminal processing protease CtpA/Prc